MSKTFYFFIFLLISYKSFSQYYGGSGSGSDLACYSQQFSTNYQDFFYGGNGDGYALNCYSQQFSTNYQDFFYGGNGDGFSKDCFQQQFSTNYQDFFYGGDGDGHSKACYTQLFSTNYQDFFYGGNGDGFSKDCFTQQFSSNYQNFFFGGNGDGHAKDCHTQLFSTNYQDFFYGGNGDGFSKDCFAQQFSTNYQDFFYGGNGDGHSEDCFTQGMSPIYSSFFKGGLSNGATYSCGIIDFSSSTLPIELLSFSGINDGDINLLFWSTSTEINNDYFTLYRSSEGENWQEISTVEGAGNSNILIDYEETDYEPEFPTSYYLLKQTDFDGTETLSKIVVITKKGQAINNGLINIYPNPTTANINFNYYFEQPKNNLNIELYNVTGQLVLNKQFMISDKGVFKNSINLDNLSSGLYTILFRENNKMQSLKIILSK